MELFLNNALKKVNTYSQKQREDIKEKFLSVMEDCHAIFGSYAFRRITCRNLYDYRDGHWQEPRLIFRRGPMNRAIFELWSVRLSHLESWQRQILIQRKDEVLLRFAKVLEEPEFSSAIRGGKTPEIRYRMERGKKFVEELLHE